MFSSPSHAEDHSVGQRPGDRCRTHVDEYDWVVGTGDLENPVADRYVLDQSSGSFDFW
jgi:hypothetical protein